MKDDGHSRMRYKKKDDRRRRRKDGRRFPFINRVSTIFNFLHKHCKKLNYCTCDQVQEAYSS